MILSATSCCCDTDRLLELRFYIPLDTKQAISETFTGASLLACCRKKLNLTQQKNALANQKEIYHNAKETE